MSTGGGVRQDDLGPLLVAHPGLWAAKDGRRHYCGHERVARRDDVVGGGPPDAAEGCRSRRCGRRVGRTVRRAPVIPLRPRRAIPSGGAGSAAPASDAAGEIDAAGVERGLAALPAIIDRYWKQTGVPGVAIAVVYDGKVRYLEGVGARQVGKPETVDPDTVFQLASVSKPISSTVVAAAFTKKLSSIGWDDPVQKVLPGLPASPTRG